MGSRKACTEVGIKVQPYQGMPLGGITRPSPLASIVSVFQPGKSPTGRARSTANEGPQTLGANPPGTAQNFVLRQPIPGQKLFDD